MERSSDPRESVGKPCACSLLSVVDRLPALLLLRHRDRFWERVAGGDHLGRLVLSLVPFVALSSAAYGAVLAGWRSPLLALYVAVKFPLLLFGTTSLVMLLNWMVATAGGSGLNLKQVVAVTYGAMGIACWILLSLVPVTALFTFGVASATGTHEELRLTHNCLLLTHIAFIAFAGFAGNAALRQGLAAAVRPGCSPDRIYAGWIVSFAIVGCQLSWILRPFVGSPFYGVAFMRPDALSRNFFEFVLGEVLPNVLRGGQ
jgi:hypothetical protein